jgi:hypothetical protein
MKWHMKAMELPSCLAIQEDNLKWHMKAMELPSCLAIQEDNLKGFW